MTSPASLPDLAEAVEVARQRSVAWLATLQAPDAPDGVSRVSAAHDVERWPGVLLHGTYDAVMTRRLIGAPMPPTAPLLDWLCHHRLADGRFRNPQMQSADLWKKPDAADTREYVDFHVTNYALGAVAALDPDVNPTVEFIRPFLEPMRLGWWLSRRDLRDPWQEGNNIVNLGGFLLALRRVEPTSAPAVDAAMRAIFDWHDRLQEPATGFWGVGQDDPERRLHAFAGSMHNYHLFYATDRPVPHHTRAIDYVLSLPPMVHSACIDIDAVDLLVHGAARTSWRLVEINDWLARMLKALLAVQRDDGGFADVATGERRIDGWVRGYVEPQGLSNTFATFFRWIAIAMAADHLFPGQWPWRFRREVGIGYRWPGLGP